MNINLANIDFAPGQGGGGGQAVWGGITGTLSNQTDLMNKFNDYATEDWVEDQGYLSSDNPAVEPLENTSEGMLYTKVLEAGKVYKFDAHSGSYVSIPDVTYYLNGEYYIFLYPTLYKYNQDNFTLTPVVNTDSWNNQPFWSDATGRVYIGARTQFDMTTGAQTAVDLGISYYSNQNYYIDNIFKGKKGIYAFADQSCQKFNEDDQVFESFTFTVPSGFSDFYKFAAYNVEYEGHIIWVYNGDMYEFVEGDDLAEIVKVDVPYFDLTVDNFGYELGPYTTIIKFDGDYYMLNSNTGYNYKLTNGNWVHRDITYEDGSGLGYSGQVIPMDNYVFGGTNTNLQGVFAVFNPSNEPYKFTYWTGTNNVAVDLSSNQNIEGFKSFTGASFDSINIRIVGYDSNSGSTDINLGKSEIRFDKLNITNTGTGMYNGEFIATTDKCILNKTYASTGPLFNRIEEFTGEVRFSTVWRTNTGRVFVYNFNTDSTYEFNGSTMTQVTLTVQPANSANFVYVTTSDTFYVDNSGQTYIWDDSNSDWVYICSNNNFTQDPNYTFVCGSTLRFMDSLKLVNNGGTWSWESDQMSQSWKYGRGVVCNGTVYVFSNDSYIYTYDEATTSYTQVMYFDNNGLYKIFVFDNKLYYVSDGVRYVDLTLNTITLTNIFYVNYDYAYAEYNGHLFTQDSQRYVGYVYDVTESVPEVPASNGTYSLKATRVGDQITYSWVLDV